MVYMQLSLRMLGHGRMKIFEMIFKLSLEQFLLLARHFLWKPLITFLGSHALLFTQYSILGVYSHGAQDNLFNFYTPPSWISSKIPNTAKGITGLLILQSITFSWPESVSKL